MKKLLLISSICTLAAVLCPAQENRIPFADPYILEADGIYYMYGTSYDDGIGVVMSTDLKNWTVPGGTERHVALSKDDSYGNFWFWAPEVYHVGDRYYMYYSSEEHICAAVSDSPLGPFRQEKHVPMLEEKGIDNSLFIDDDGTPYIFWVRFRNGNEIWSAELEDDLMTIKKETMRFCMKMSQEWEKIWPAVNEGPFVVKHKGRYYLTYSANSYESQDYGIGYATSDSICGPWVKYDGNPVLCRPEGLYGVGHHALFKDHHGRNRITFHSHFSDTKIHPRVIHISSWRIDRKGILRISRRKIRTPQMAGL